MNIYLAGTIERLNWNEASVWREEAITLLNSHEVYNPCEHIPDFERGNIITCEEIAQPELIVVQDLHNLRKSDILLVKLGEASVGTLIELGIAYALETTIVGWGKGSVTSHPFIKEVVKARFDTLPEAADFINNL